MFTSLFAEPVRVAAGQRALVIDNGALTQVLTAGARLPEAKARQSIRLLDARAVLPKDLDAYVRDCTQASVLSALQVFETSEDEVGFLTLDGKRFSFIGWGGRQVVFADAGEWAFRAINVADQVLMTREDLRAISVHPTTTFASKTLIGEGRVGLLWIDGVITEVLQPGSYGVWTLPSTGASSVLAKSRVITTVSTRWTALAVRGQEIMTKDKVSVRANLTGQYRVTDPKLAGQMVGDAQELVYAKFQLAARDALAAKTLEALLAFGTDLDGLLADKINDQLAEFGLEVRDLGLMDLILPGDIRELMNQVIAAEKAAQANVIKRREETAATRSLLNTAQLMEQNPLLLRLKELEVLDQMVGKVGSIEVRNGLDGLLNELVQLQPVARG